MSEDVKIPSQILSCFVSCAVLHFLILAHARKRALHKLGAARVCFNLDYRIEEAAEVNEALKDFIHYTWNRMLHGYAFDGQLHGTLYATLSKPPKLGLCHSIFTYNLWICTMYTDIWWSESQCFQFLTCKYRTVFCGSDRKWGNTIISQNELHRSLACTKMFLSVMAATIKCSVLLNSLYT